MRRRNGVKTSHEMNLYKEETNIQGESTTSSDSGVVVEEQSPNLETDGITNIKTELKIDPHCSTQDDITTVHINDFNKEVKVEDIDERAPSLSSHSERSHNISIVSLDDADSSVIDSDSDFSDAPGDLIVRKLGQHSEFGKDGAIVINQHIGREPTCSSDGVGISSKPQIGSIAVQNSTDITFGNKTFYQGPVTIKQFLLENKKWTPTEGGADNPGFEDDKDTRDDNNHGGLYGNGIRKKRLFDSKPVFIIGVIILLSTIVCAITFTTLAFQKSVYVSNKPGDGEDSRKNIPINSTIGVNRPPLSKWESLKRWLKTRTGIITIIIIILIITCSSAALTTKLLEDPEIRIPDGSVLRLITRDEWSARPPNANIENMKLPIGNVIIAHTDTEPCTTISMCTFRVYNIQTHHMDKALDFNDIGYQFLVGGDGAAYEGRGWDKIGAHTIGYNRNSVCIAFIGTFGKKKPNDKQLKAAKLLIEEGVRQRKLATDYKLYGARQLTATESPGDALYEIIQTWPHWSDEKL